MKENNLQNNAAASNNQNNQVFTDSTTGKKGVKNPAGQIIVPAEYDELLLNPFTGLYHACWGNVKGKYGMVAPNGEVLIPNILTSTYAPWNDFMLLEADGKFGAMDVRTLCFVLPEYDKVDWEPDENVVFHKGGVKGYIVEETGEFVPIDQFEDDEKYDDAYIFNTFCDN